ncbi:hypothetical protein MAHJHV65_47350 [Mycobacterium avium subsp. hominissuis]
MSSREDGEAPDDAPRAKIDETDHDLLTFGEAGERLRLEIDATQRSIEQCGSDNPVETARARARLELLRAATRRNAAQPINDANFERFFGYPGTAKRNLPPQPDDA